MMSMFLFLYHQQRVRIWRTTRTGYSTASLCQLPKDIQNEINSLKHDVNHLKTTTKFILSPVNNLSTKLETAIGSINDRLTAEPCHDKTCIRGLRPFPTSSDTNRAVESLKKVRGLEFLFKVEKGCSGNKGADLLCGYRADGCAFNCAYSKLRFSHDATQL